MPVYNSENFVETAVKSILAQSFKDFEIICVNDCSKDNSLAVLNKLAQSDSRIKVIDSKVNVGAGAARNLGIEAATGQYITFVDSDDTIESDLFERAFSLCDNGKIDQVVWGMLEKYYTADNKLVKTISVVPSTQIYTDFESITRAILELEEKTLFGYQCNSIYKTNIIKEHNIRFEKAILYEDFFFNLEFAKYMTSLSSLDYDGYNYFKRVNTSITHSFVKDYFELSCRRIEDMYNFCKARNYTNEKVINILGNRLLRYTLSAICRNLKPQSNMNGCSRKAWFSSLLEIPIYKEIIPNCVPSNIVHSFIKFTIIHKSYFLASFLGKLVNSIK